ncbi:hypothetical protein [uncultured Sulfitobacter sp.]|uniref:hypothetical protein n=1 Tax=uncultured Sulfitobacter sp. TaxID=191468 RepID=UPI0030FC65CD
MNSIKVTRGFSTLRLNRAIGAQAIILSVVLARSAAAESCYPPARPFVPNDPQAAREYSDLIRGDFELYIRDVQSYFRCLDEERARAFEEAHEVSQEYGRFLQTVGD